MAGLSFPLSLFSGSYNPASVAITGGTITGVTLTSVTLVTSALGTPSSGVVTNLTGTASGVSIGGSAASLSISGQTGLMTVTGLASTNRVKTVRDAADTILELGGSYTPTGTWTNLTMVTPVLGTPTSGNLTNCTGYVGTSTLVTVGTITTGVWNAGAVTSSSTISAATGVAVGGATAGTGGVAFPATAVAVADANTLDDYEEGEWTSTWTCGTSGTVTVDPSFNKGMYTKIGRKVTVTGYFTFSSVSSPVGSMTMGGLPFAAASSSQRAGWTAAALTCQSMISGNCFVGSISSGTSSVVIQLFAAGTTTDAAAVFQANSVVYVSLTYFV